MYRYNTYKYYRCHKHLHMDKSFQDRQHKQYNSLFPCAEYWFSDLFLLRKMKVLHDSKVHLLIIFHICAFSYYKRISENQSFFCRYCCILWKLAFSMHNSRFPEQICWFRRSEKNSLFFAMKCGLRSYKWMRHCWNDLSVAHWQHVLCTRALLSLYPARKVLWQFLPSDIFDR